MVRGCTYSFGTLSNDGWELDISEREGYFTDMSWNFDALGDPESEEEMARVRLLKRSIKELNKRFVPGKTKIKDALRLLEAFFVLEGLEC